MSSEIVRSENTEDRCLDEAAVFGLVEGSTGVQHAHFPSESLPSQSEEKQKYSEKGDPITYLKDNTHGLVKANEVGIAEKGSSDKERDSEPEDGNNFPHGFTLIALTIALMISTFMVALDTNVIGTAIPKITSRFNSLNDVGWYGSAYLLTLMSLQPTYGKIYTHFNIKWTFLAALLIFELGSTVCATASRSWVFICGRAISGVGAAGILSGSLTIGGHLVPLVKRPLYMSIIMSMYGVASVAGPTLGGVLTDSETLTWRFCFWLNLPFGGLATLVFVIMLNPPERQGLDLSIKAKVMRMDFAGAILWISAIVCLLLVLQWGGLRYAWTDSKVLGCLFGFAGLACLFVIVQVRRKEEATIPLRIFFQRTVAAGCCFTAFLNMAIDTHIYYLPFYFQAVKSTSASGSGVRILPYLATMIITAVGSGSCITALGYYVPFMWLGAALLTVGSALLHTLNVESGVGKWIGYQLLSGIGFGMAFQIPYSALHVALSADDLPTGNALIVFFQAFGGALAVSIGQNILSNSLIEQLKQNPQLDPAAIVTAGATNIGTAVPSELMGVVREAYSYALSRTFILPIVGSGMAFLCSLGMEWRTIGKRR